MEGQSLKNSINEKKDKYSGRIYTQELPGIFSSPSPGRSCCRWCSRDTTGIPPSRDATGSASHSAEEGKYVCVCVCVRERSKYGS